jgi:hypothetical protein
MDIKVPDQVVRLRNEDDEIILEASLLDITTFLGYYALSFMALEGDHITAEEYISRLKSMVEPFNKEFNCELTWSQLNVLLNSIEEPETELKKN